MAGIYHQIPFYLSSEIDLDVKVYIGHLYQKCVTQIKEHWNQNPQDLYISVQLYQCGLAQHEVPCVTHIAALRQGNLHWDEWVTIPFRIRDLTRFDQLSICLIGVGHQILAGTTIRLFDKKMRLKRGLQQLMLWPTLSSIATSHIPGVNAKFDEEWPPKRPGVPSSDINSDKARKGTARDDLNEMLSSRHSQGTQKQDGTTTTHTGNGTMNGTSSADAKASDDMHVHPETQKFPLDSQAPAVSLYYWDEDFHAAKLREKYEHHEVQHAPWLDRLSIRQLESHRNRRTSAVGGEDVHPTGIKLFDAKQLQLVETSDGKKDVVAVPWGEESNSDETSSPQPLVLYIHFPYFHHEVVYDEQLYDINFQPFGTSSSSIHSLWEIPDSGPDPSTNPWANRLNIIPDPEVESSNPVERKYNKLSRGLVRTFVDPNLKPNRIELDKIESIVNNPTYKLDSQESSLLWKFRYSLLSNPKALPKFVLAVDWTDESESSLATELINQWAPIDADDALRLLSPDFHHRAVRQFAVDTLHRCSDEELVHYLLQLVQALRYEPQLSGISESVPNDELLEEGDYTPSAEEQNLRPQNLSPLADFLIQRASESPLLANYFHWYLTVELEDSAFGTVFSYVHSVFLENLKHSEKGQQISREISRQADFVRELMSAVEVAKGERSIERKTSTLKEYLRPGGMYHTLTNLQEPILLPLDPRYKITGIQPNKCKVFRSSVYPTLFVFTVEKTEKDRLTADAESSAPSPDPEGSDAAAAKEDDKHSQEQDSFQVLVKLGDDLRQDQLIIQMVQLMDKCLKKVNVDLQLTPYRVLATGTRSGMMEFVSGSCAVAQVKQDILGFFKKKHPSDDLHGVDKKVMTTYVQSCAGYCVITYLLGVGDRHFDNLLIRDTGHLFHIDFGYIFGRDPKPLPPPMKLTTHMIWGMGGVKSPYYEQFRKYCCQAYTIIRRSANLFLNLLNLMRDAGIADMGAHPEVTLMKVQEKFRLDVGDEEAERAFLKLVDESVAALFPHFTDFIHKLATRMR